MVIPFEASDLEVIALDKALEVQRMDILQRNLPARFDTGASGGPSPGDAMTLYLSAFEERTDMLERTRVASDGAPGAARVKTMEQKRGAVLEGALSMHGCIDTSGLPSVYAELAATPKGEHCVAGSLPDPRECTRRGDVHSARLPLLHKRLIHGVLSPRHEFERLGERDLPDASLGHVNYADTGALRCAAGF